MNTRIDLRGRRMKPSMPGFAVAFAIAFVASACSGAAAPASTAAAATAGAAATETPVAAASAHDQHEQHAAPNPALPKMVVHKSPTCGGCSVWVEHVRAAGFQVEVRDRDDLHPIKQRLGVPYGKGSCHTAEVGGYFVEGHVPATDIQRLLKEKPKARGLVVPGMPAGSPGMEMPDGSVQAYAVELVGDDGKSAVYARH